MGIYLNSKSPYLLFQRESASAYFVDKTEILKDLVPLVGLEEDLAAKQVCVQARGQKYVCITRPRRLGKTVMANMIPSYFSKGVDSRETFQKLKASRFAWFEEHLNQHNVIHIMFNEVPDEMASYAQYIARIKRRLMNDLCRAYPDAGIE